MNKDSLKQARKWLERANDDLLFAKAGFKELAEKAFAAAEKIIKFIKNKI